MEAVKTLLSFSQVTGATGKARHFFGKGRIIVPEAPLTPQTSDAESDEETREAAATAVPMDLAFTREEKEEPLAPPARVSVIMKAHSDGTFEPAKLLGEPKREETVEGRFDEIDLSKNFPAPAQPPSRKTDGSEMTSGHRDKNIPMTGGAMALSGDAHSSPRIATTTRAPVLISDTPNLQNSANSKSPSQLDSCKFKSSSLFHKY